MSSEQKHKRGLRKELVGVVTSNAMQKTITVSVERLKFHPIYKKGIKWTKKYKAHDEENKAKVGDLVRIRECRPLSKTKRWRLVEIIKSAEVLRKRLDTVEPLTVEEELAELAGTAERTETTESVDSVEE